MDNSKQYIREGQKVTFSAQLEKGDRRLTSWIVYEGNQCDDNHIIKEEKQVGTEFSHIFEKAGEYTIVSYGKRDEINKSTATQVQVGKDIFEGIECISTSISRKINDGKWEVLLDKEVKFRVKIKKQFYENLKKTGFSKLKIKIISSKNETSNAKQDKNDRTIITYNTRYLEEYSIVAEYGEEKVMAKMKVVKKFEESIAKNSSTEITTIPSGIENVRSKDSLKLNFNPKLCFIAGEPEINPSNLVWKLNGNTLLAKGTQIEIPREQIANCKKNNKVEVFKNNASTKSIASYNFSVVKNEIIKFDVSETPKFGKKVTFKVKEDKKYMTFPKLEANEEIYWEVKKGSIFVARGTGFTFEHKFNEEGDFQVRCYISNVVIEEIYNNIKQPKILPNTAKWIDKDGASGNILKKAGYYQEVCAYIEHQELVGEKVTLFIYEKDTNQLIHTEKEFTIKNKTNICIPFTLEKPTVVKDVMQVYFRIKPINSELNIKNIKNQTEEYLTVVNRGDVVDAYFCDANDTKIYRAIEVGTVDLHFKLYMTNMLKKEVEILFYIFKPFTTTIPAKDCLNWVHWEMIAGYFSKKQPFHTTKAKVNNKGEILVEVPTKRLLQIKDFTRIFAVFKIMGSDGKVKGAYLESGNFLTLIPNNSLTHMKENFAPVKVMLKKLNQDVLRQEIGESKEDNNSKYFILKSGKIKYLEGNNNKNDYYVERGVNTFKILFTLEKNSYGMVKIPDSGKGFGRYGTVDAGGTSGNEIVGKGDRYLLPNTVAALFGIIDEVAEKNWEIHLGDMSSENGSDPWQKGSNHHAGHGHKGNRKGLDIDFRYLNKSGISFHGKHSSSIFDKSKNKVIFQLAYKYGFRKNYCTNASSVFGEKILGIVEGVGGHEDHGHIGLTNIDIQNITKEDILKFKIINQ